MERNEAIPAGDWHNVDIVAELHKRKMTLRSLSLSVGLKPDTLKNALARSYPKGERIIANALNVEPSSIWPSRYNKD